MDQYLWWRDGIIYQIYPRSFQDSNGDGIGDLPGITSRLDYLADLGIDAIWLSPIYPSPDIDFGYDVSNYTAIDPKFGSMEDFNILVREAHKRNIRVVLDLVLNHTSDQHPWFLEAKKSKANPFHDYYLWREPRPGNKAPNNWQSVFGGGGWEWNEETGEYYFHMFYKEQPDVNWRNPKVRQEMLDVFRFWCDKGVDGFRLDVFNAYFKHKDLPDNPYQFGIRPFDRLKHIYDADQPEMFALTGEIRAILDSYSERYAVGETFLGGVEKAAEYCKPGLLHAAFDFELEHCRWNAQKMNEVIQRWENALHEGSWPNNVMNNHDTPRSATRFGQGENDQRLKTAATLLLTLRGTPFLYYGEEIGMRDIPIRKNQIQDPIGKHYWPFYSGRDGCRSPMQWDSSLNSGFSKGNGWLPLHMNAMQRNVETQSDDPNSLFNYYKKLITLRKNSTALRQGMYQALTFEPRSLMAYLRQSKEETILVALNFSRRKMNLVLGGMLRDSKWELLISSQRKELPVIKNSMLTMFPNEAIVMQQVNVDGLRESE